MYQCDSGFCIPAYKRCNGVIDCPHDISDELDCAPLLNNEIDSKLFCLKEEEKPPILFKEEKRNHTIPSTLGDMCIISFTVIKNHFHY